MRSVRAGSIRRMHSELMSLSPVITESHGVSSIIVIRKFPSGVETHTIVVNTYLGVTNHHRYGARGFAKIGERQWLCIVKVGLVYCLVDYRE